MMILVLGPNGSGKSLYAEKLSTSLAKGPLKYIATMVPYGKEGQIRVEKHIKQREGLGFTTIEEALDLNKLSFDENSLVLLEDVSNLLSNNIFGNKDNENEDNKDIKDYDYIEGLVFKDILHMGFKVETSILVSIDGLKEDNSYNQETNDYIRALDNLNRRLYRVSDLVIAMKDKKAEILKGEAKWSGLEL